MCAIFMLTMAITFKKIQYFHTLLNVVGRIMAPKDTHAVIP